MTSLNDSEWAGNGGRVVDIGAAFPAEEEDGEEYAFGKNLVVFAVDPGYDTGWSALKVPVARLLATGPTRTLPWCRWQHGEIRRSGAPSIGSGHMADAVSESRHTTLILDTARDIYERFVYVQDEEGEKEGWETDEFVFVLESFDLRMMSMDRNLLAPVRILSRLTDRMWMLKSQLPVFYQTPSEAMGSVTDARLRSWGMYDRSSGVHARDADRHSIHFTRRFAESRRVREGLGFAV